MTTTIKLLYSRTGIFKERKREFIGKDWKEAVKAEQEWREEIGSIDIIDRRIIENTSM
ncbi:MAG: hypothetical protein WC707_07120 [Candidatus Babeliaceae bacterium]|jgi:hypothetical protein